MEHYLKDNSFKIMGILLDKKYAVFVHRDVLRYMIKILKYSKEDLKKHIIWRYNLQWVRLDPQ